MSIIKTENSVRLVGRIAKEPQTVTFDNNATVTKLIVCTENAYKDRDGQWKKDPEFSNVIVRGRNARQASQLAKGEMVEISGRLKTRSYEVNGGKKYTTEVVCWEAKPVGGTQQEGTILDDNFWNR